MRILIEFSTTNYKMWHSLAKRLKAIYPNSQFAGLVGASPSGPDVIDFLNTQMDVKYEFLLDKDAIAAEMCAIPGEIDFNELKRYEQSLPFKSVWRIIAADRNIGNAYMHGIGLKNLYSKGKRNYKEILKYFYNISKKYRSIFDSFAPDLFLPAVGMGSILVFIFEQICKERGIPYIVPTNIRVKNIFAFSTDSQLRFAQIEKTYKELDRGDIEVDLSDAKNLYDELMAEIEDPQYFDRKNEWFNMGRIDSFQKKLRFILALPVFFLKSLLQHIIELISGKRPHMSLKGKLFYYFHQKHQEWLMLCPGFCEELDPKQKYIYYPLHINPEYSTQIMAPMWLNQLYVIELLSKSIPCDWVIYVKEHPTTLFCRVRPWGFYEKIKQLPNVRLAPIDADMHKIISKAEMVAVITGTSGWEAIMRGKPLITFTNCFWDVLELSSKCSDIETFSRDIQDEFSRAKGISPAERKRRLILFLAALLQHGFEISYPQQFCYSKKGTDEEYEIVGRETAEALKRHLDKLKVGE